MQEGFPLDVSSARGKWLFRRRGFEQLKDALRGCQSGVVIGSAVERDGVSVRVAGGYDAVGSKGLVDRGEASSHEAFDPLVVLREQVLEHQPRLGGVRLAA